MHQVHQILLPAFGGGAVLLPSPLSIENLLTACCFLPSQAAILVMLLRERDAEGKDSTSMFTSCGGVCFRVLTLLTIYHILSTPMLPFLSIETSPLELGIAITAVVAKIFFWTTLAILVGRPSRSLCPLLTAARINEVCGHCCVVVDLQRHLYRSYNHGCPLGFSKRRTGGSCHAVADGDINPPQSFQQDHFPLSRHTSLCAPGRPFQSYPVVKLRRCRFCASASFYDGRINASHRGLGSEREIAFFCSGSKAVKDGLSSRG